jgi:hypothetical protein
MKSNHYSRKQRQLKYLVKQLNNLLEKSDKKLWLEIQKIATKISFLIKELNGVISSYSLKKIIGGIALFVGMSFSNTASAQYFAYPVSNPFSITPGYTNVIQSTNLVDIDNDGDLDLFTDSLTYAGYYSFAENFNYQENIGTATIPNFNIPQLNPFNLTLPIIDTSIIKMRHFIDLDGDGDLDVLSNVAYQGYYSFSSNFRYYENIGTPTAPDFIAPVLNPFGLQGSSSSPKFSSLGDLDNDGDYDLINSIVNYNGSSWEYIENTGTNTNPIFGSNQGNIMNLPNTIGLILPTLADLDSDGDLDLIFGQETSYAGEFKYCENIGTTSTVFDFPTTNPFGLNGSLFDGPPNLEFKDLDGDNDLDLLAGLEDRTLYFDNVGVQQPVTYECINYSCIDPGTGNGSYSTLSACQTSCMPPVSYECDFSSQSCFDPGDGSGFYTSYNDCMNDCVPPPSYECDWNGDCYDPGNGSGIYNSYSDCINDCEAQPTWNCISPGDCQDPGDATGNFWDINDCLNNCNVQPTWNCDATLGCIDPGDGTGVYSSLTNCQYDCNTTSIESMGIQKLKIFPNPVNNTLNIICEKDITKIEIYDALGRIIISKENPSNHISVEELKNGLYTVSITLKDNKIVRKFQK